MDESHKVELGETEMTRDERAEIAGRSAGTAAAPGSALRPLRQGCTPTVGPPFSVLAGPGDGEKARRRRRSARVGARVAS